VYRYGRQCPSRGGEAALEVEVAAPLTVRAAPTGAWHKPATRERCLSCPGARRARRGAAPHRVAGADRAYAGAEVEVATRQTRLNRSTSRRVGYTLLNLTAVWCERCWRIGRVDLAVKNVTNASYGAS